jgi:hypothetical protein
MQQSRTHRHGDTWRMKDKQQGQHNHRNERRQQRNTGTEAEQQAKPVPIAAPRSEPHTAATGWPLRHSAKSSASPQTVHQKTPALSGIEPRQRSQ